MYTNLQINYKLQKSQFGSMLDYKTKSYGLTYVLSKSLCIRSQQLIKTIQEVSNFNLIQFN